MFKYFLQQSRIWAAAFFLLFASSGWQLPSAHAAMTPFAIGPFNYGTGADGSAVISDYASYSSGGTFNYTDLTISGSNAELTFSTYNVTTIYVSGTLTITNNGLLNMNGGDVRASIYAKNIVIDRSGYLKGDNYRFHIYTDNLTIKDNGKMLIFDKGTQYDPILNVSNTILISSSANASSEQDTSYSRPGGLEIESGYSNSSGPGGGFESYPGNGYVPVLANKIYVSSGMGIYASCHCSSSTSTIQLTNLLANEIHLDAPRALTVSGYSSSSVSLNIVSPVIDMPYMTAVEEINDGKAYFTTDSHIQVSGEPAAYNYSETYNQIKDNIASQTSVLDNRLGTLNSSFTDQTARLEAALNNQNTTLGSQTTAMNNQVTALNNQKTSLDNQTAALNSQTTALNNQTTAVNNQTSEIVKNTPFEVELQAANQITNTSTTTKDIIVNVKGRVKSSLTYKYKINNNVWPAAWSAMPADNIITASGLVSGLNTIYVLVQDSYGTTETASINIWKL